MDNPNNSEVISNKTHMSRFLVAHRWGKQNLKRHQMVPLHGASWVWDKYAPGYAVRITDVIVAEAQPGFAEWLIARGGTPPTIPLGAVVNDEAADPKMTDVEIESWIRGASDAYRLGILPNSRVERIERIPGWSWAPTQAEEVTQ